MCHAQEHTPRGPQGGFCGRTSCFMSRPGAKGGLVKQQLGQDAYCHGPSPPGSVCLARHLLTNCCLGQRSDAGCHLITGWHLFSEN